MRAWVEPCIRAAVKPAGRAGEAFKTNWCQKFSAETVHSVLEINCSAGVSSSVSYSRHSKQGDLDAKYVRKKPWSRGFSQFLLKLTVMSSHVQRL